MLEVINALGEVIEKLIKIDIGRNKAIEDYLRKIEQDLIDIVSKIESGGRPTVDGLRVHAEDLPRRIGYIIGEREANSLSNQLVSVADNLSNQLVSAVDNSPEVDVNLRLLKELISSIKAYADKVPLPRSPRSSISRRTLIYSAFGTSAAFATGWFGSKQTSSSSIKQTSPPSVKQTSSPSVRWKMVSVFPKDISNFEGKENTNKPDLILPKVPKMICDRIKEMTDGDFIIEIDESEELDTDEILKKVSDREIECGYSGIFYAKPKYKALFFGCAIPFGLSPQEQTAWLLYRKNDSGELTFMQSIYPKLGLNIIPFPAGGTGRQMGGWFNQKVELTTDFKDLTIRIPGLGGEVLKEFGAKTDSMNIGTIPIHKIKDNLQNGRLNAAEWNGPHDDMELGLHKVAKYYYYPGWWEPSSTLDIQVNLDAWDELPKPYRAIFKAVCQETYAKTIAEYNQKNSVALQKLEREGNIELIEFSENIIENARKKTNNLLDYHKKENPIFEEVYEEWISFQKRIQNWSKLNENKY
jgi:TRAP-type mannitol/chloroaromatic compound transport system substrate-binding protein